MNVFPFVDINMKVTETLPIWNLILLNKWKRKPEGENVVYIFIKNWPVLKYRMLKYLATAGVNNNAISEIAPMSLASTGNL